MTANTCRVIRDGWTVADGVADLAAAVMYCDIFGADGDTFLVFDGSAYYSVTVRGADGETFLEPVTGSGVPS